MPEASIIRRSSPNLLPVVLATFLAGSGLLLLGLSRELQSDSTRHAVKPQPGPLRPVDRRDDPARPGPAQPAPGLPSERADRPPAEGSMNLPDGPALPQPEPPVREQPAQRAPSPPAPPAEPEVGDPAGRAAALLHRQSREADARFQREHGLSDDEDRQVGERMHREACQEMAVLKSGALVDRLRRLGRPLAEQCRRVPEVHYHGLRRSDYNAFAHAGGHIYATAALSQASNDDEFEFVVGHETAHLELGHCRGAAAYLVRAEQWYGPEAVGLASMAHRVVALGYSEDQEYEADAWAYHVLRRLGRTHEQATAALRLMQRLVPEPVARRDSHSEDAVTREVNNHFRSHPPNRSRQARLERLRHD